MAPVFIGAPPLPPPWVFRHLCQGPQDRLEITQVQAGRSPLLER